MPSKSNRPKAAAERRVVRYQRRYHVEEIEFQQSSSIGIAIESAIERLNMKNPEFEFKQIPDSMCIGVTALQPNKVIAVIEHWIPVYGA